MLYAIRLHNAAMHKNDSEGIPSERVLIEAIALKRVVTAVYNGSEMALAPHSLISRHEALFLSALNVRRVVRSEEEPRLGLFKLAGLSAIALTDDTFEAAVDPKVEIGEGDELVFAV